MQWYAKLTEVSYARGYKHSSNDYFLFYRKTEGFNIFLGVYMDDILVTGDVRMKFKALRST